MLCFAFTADTNQTIEWQAELCLMNKRHLVPAHLHNATASQWQWPVNAIR